MEEKQDIVLYQIDNANVCVSVFYKDETFWLTRMSMAELFGVGPQAISKHLGNIYKEDELDRESTSSKMELVQNEGGVEKKRDVDFYNLDAIIAVGYRVNSKKATKFRQWATKTLKEYITKGFVLNDDMLKNGKPFGKDYFDELLERIRDIRASEKRVYQKVKEIFALSVDYDSKSEVAQNFFKSVQNKLEYAATGHTAPEIIVARADASKDNMGLTSFKGAKVRRGDVTVAKNYMTHDEISTLNLIVNMYLDYAELQAKGHNPMHMADWENKLGDFLRFNGREVLKNLGTVRREVAEKLALEQYEKFDAHRRALEAADDVDELTAGVKRLKA